MYINICKQMLMVASAASNRQCIHAVRSNPTIQLGHIAVHDWFMKENWMSHDKTWLTTEIRNQERNKETKKQSPVKLKDQC